MKPLIFSLAALAVLASCHKSSVQPQVNPYIVFSVPANTGAVSFDYILMDGKTVLGQGLIQSTANYSTEQDLAINSGVTINLNDALSRNMLLFLSNIEGNDTIRVEYMYLSVNGMYTPVATHSLIISNGMENLDGHIVQGVIDLNYKP